MINILFIMVINSNRILHITNNDFDGEGHAVLRLHNGILKRGNEVYTEIVLDFKSATLQRIIKGKTGVESVVYSEEKPY